MSILAQLEITGVVSTDLFCLRGITILVKKSFYSPFSGGKPNVKPTRGNLLGYAFKDSLCVFGFVFKIGTSRVFGVIMAILLDGPNPSPKIVQKQSNNLYSHFLYICIL